MKKIVVISGSGLDKESGIPTFRDKEDGLWNDIDVMEVASVTGWRKNRQKVLEFCNQCHKEFLSKTPNSAHYDIADLEKEYEVVNITQNVSNLLEKAGCSKVIHLHGDLTKMRTFNSNISYLWPDDLEITISSVNDDDELIRPDIVLFGEDVPNFEPATKEVMDADIVIIIGTSLTVYPAASLSEYSKKGTPIYVIDPGEIESTNFKFTHIKSTATEGMKTLLNLLKNEE